MDSLTRIRWTEEHIMLRDRTALENHSYVATAAKTNRNSFHWILTSKKKLSNYCIIHSTLSKRKENARDYTTDTWQRVNKIVNTLHAVNKQDSEKDKRMKESKNMVMQSTLAHTGGSSKSRGRTCRQLYPRQQIVGSKQLENEKLEFQTFFMVWRFFDFVHRVRTSFGCLEKKFQTIDGGCEQNTHSCSMCRFVQQDHIASREHACLKSCKAQDCTSWSLWNNCHPRVMSRSLPHLTLITSTSSFSPISSTSPTFPTISPS